MRVRKSVLAAALVSLSLGGAVAAPAQERERREAERELEEARRQLRETERRIRELERRLGVASVRIQGREPFAYSLLSMMNRARLGVVVKTARDPATDSVGALLQAVTPGAPAEKAGLKAGDIITKFNGERLTGRNPSASADESEPGIRLVELARGLDPGDTVRLEYRRGRDMRTATVVAQDVDPSGLSVMVAPRVRLQADSLRVFMDSIRLHLDTMRLKLEPLGGLSLPFSLPGRWLDIEMVGLNPELGEYFGAADGVLVVRAPKDESLNLKSGDVILKIGSRAPTSAAHALRILRSYEPGETVTLEIMRQKRKMTLTVQVPERRMGTWFAPEGTRVIVKERTRGHEQ